MAETKIEWADKVWNPVSGCSHAGSPGCDHCYAKRMANRLKGRYGYPADDPFRVTFHPERLDEVLPWKKPGGVFVCSMGDLFHEDVPEEVIIRVLCVADQATTWIQGSESRFFFLTKRPQRMKNVVEKVFSQKAFHPERLFFGVTAENQKTADERIPILLQIPAAKRFVSIEPMLGPVDLFGGDVDPRIGHTAKHPYLEPWWKPGQNGPPNPCLDWVICGGEAGPGARPMHPGWVRSLRDQCQAAGVPFFFKQWGAWGIHPMPAKRNEYTGAGIFLRPDGGYGSQGEWWEGRAQAMDKMRRGQKSGRLLDGREWNEFPE